MTELDLDDWPIVGLSAHSGMATYYFSYNMVFAMLLIYFKLMSLTPNCELYTQTQLADHKRLSGRGPQSESGESRGLPVSIYWFFADIFL